jgi:hypothetical protein
MCACARAWVRVCVCVCVRVCACHRQPAQRTAIELHIGRPPASATVALGAPRALADGARATGERCVSYGVRERARSCFEWVSSV